MKRYAIQSNSGIAINFGVSRTSYIIEVPVKVIMSGTLACVIMSLIRHPKLMNI